MAEVTRSVASEAQRRLGKKGPLRMIQEVRIADLSHITVCRTVLRRVAVLLHADTSEELAHV